MKDNNIIINLLAEDVIPPKEWGKFLVDNYKYQLFHGSFDNGFEIKSLSIS